MTYTLVQGQWGQLSEWLCFPNDENDDKKMAIACDEGVSTSFVGGLMTSGLK
jgi:hypothetical protein